MSDLQELFSRDPLDLTRDDIERIVKDYRTRRAQFNQGNVKAGSTKPKTEKQKEVDKLAQSLNIDLGDL